MPLLKSQLSLLADEANQLKSMNAEQAAHFAPRVLRDCVHLFDQISEDTRAARTEAKALRVSEAERQAFRAWKDIYAQLGGSMAIADESVRRLSARGVHLDQNGKFAKSWRAVRGINAMDIDGVLEGARQIARGEFVTLDQLSDEI